MNSTELWFLRETMESESFDFSTNEFTCSVQTPKFGYDEVYVDIGNTRYLIKHKTWSENWLDSKFKKFSFLRTKVQEACKKPINLRGVRQDDNR